MLVSPSSTLGRIAVVHALVLSSFLSWRFGGMEATTRMISAWLALPAPFISALALRQADAAFRRQLAWILVPLALLTTLVLISAANPHMRMIYAEGEPLGLVGREDYLHYLPSTAWPRHTLEDFLLNAGYVLAGLNVLITRPSRRVQIAALTCVTLNAAALACTGTVFKLLHATEILGRYPSPNTNFFATFVYYNHWGAFAVLGAAAGGALALYHLQQAGQRPWHSTPAPLFVVLTVLILASIPVSGGRASLAAGLIIALGLALRFVPRQLHLSARLRRSAITVAAALLVLTGATLWLARDRIHFWSNKTAGQYQEIQSGGIGDARLAVYRQTWDLFLEKPVYGWGWQSFRYAFRSVQSFDYKMENEQREASVFLDAHNDWLQRLAELGLVGATLSVATLVGLARLALRQHWLLSPSAEIVIGLVGLAALACVDFPFACPAIVVTGWMLLSVAAGIAHQRSERFPA
ncbi:O-antigen ligase family protein [Opitutus sp. ER46]|uniref:O-antigen ligase family protein n=1 Tax=Opitutus sp. ER46 TaxID=2161864 RepID=UPI0013048BC1|nr:O-antigen ligase family protein [Opitutus sp. ER46]